MNKELAIAWLEELAKNFDKIAAEKEEDKEFWACYANALSARRIAKFLREGEIDVRCKPGDESKGHSGH